MPLKHISGHPALDLNSNNDYNNCYLGYIIIIKNTASTKSRLYFFIRNSSQSKIFHYKKQIQNSWNRKPFFIFDRDNAYIFFRFRMGKDRYGQLFPMY